MREWLNKARKNRGLTMKEMANLLGISESYYCCIENGERQKKMDLMLVAGIAVALNVPIGDIAANEAAWMARKQASSN